MNVKTNSFQAKFPNVDTFLGLPMTLPHAWEGSEPKGAFSFILDAVATAAHEGLLTRSGWKNQLFANDASFNWFLEQLERFEYALEPFWFDSLIALAGRENSSFGVISNADLAEVLKVAGYHECPRLAGMSIHDEVIWPLHEVSSASMPVDIPVQCYSEPRAGMATPSVAAVIDAIGQEIHSGEVPESGWVRHLFATKVDFLMFVEQLLDWPFHLTTDQYVVLARLINSNECVPTPNLVSEMLLLAYASGEMTWFDDEIIPEMTKKRILRLQSRVFQPLTFARISA